jgi:hypothetical protein
MEPAYVEPEKTQPVNNRRLWLGLLLPIILWVLHLFASSVLTALACSWGFFSFNLWGIAGIRLILLAVTLVAAIGILFSGIMSYSLWRGLAEDEPGPERDATGQYRFLTLAGVMLSGYLIISMVWYGVTILASSLCTWT